MRVEGTGKSPGGNGNAFLAPRGPAAPSSRRKGMAFALRPRFPAGHLRGTSALLDHPNKNLRPKVRPALGDPRHLRLKRRRRKRPESRTAQRPAADGIFSRIAQKKSAGPTADRRFFHFFSFASGRFSFFSFTFFSTKD